MYYVTNATLIGELQPALYRVEPIGEEAAPGGRLSRVQTIVDDVKNPIPDVIDCDGPCFLVSDVSTKGR